MSINAIIFIILLCIFAMSIAIIILAVDLHRTKVKLSALIFIHKNEQEKGDKDDDCKFRTV